MISSGGGLSAPRSGISFAMVEVVLVMCGLSGLSIWNLRYSGAVSFARALSLVKSSAGLKVVDENGRAYVRAATRLDRKRRRADAMLSSLVTMRLGSQREKGIDRTKRVYRGGLMASMG